MAHSKGWLSIEQDEMGRWTAYSYNRERGGTITKYEIAMIGKMSKNMDSNVHCLVAHSLDKIGGWELSKVRRYAKVIWHTSVPGSRNRYIDLADYLTR